MAEQCDRTTEQPHSGCSHCTSRQDDCFLCISMLNYWSMTSTTMMCQLMTAVHVNISSSSTGCRLHKARSSRHTIYSHNSLDSVSLPCPCRVVSAPSALTRQQWSTILFTVESCFTVAFNNGRRWVWHRVGESADSGFTRSQKFATFPQNVLLRVT